MYTLIHFVDNDLYFILFVCLFAQCKRPWRKEQPRLTFASGVLKRQQIKPEEDLDAIATNTLINTLVNKYWSKDLDSNKARSKANEHFSKGQYREALRLYDEAAKLCKTMQMHSYFIA